MARPRTPVAERIERLTDGNTWLGQVRKGRPHLDRFGNPMRLRLNLMNHPDWRIYPDHPIECPDPTRCMNIHHWRAVPCVNKRKYGPGRNSGHAAG